MIPVIGLVICALVVALTADIALDSAKHRAARLVAAISLGVALVGAAMLWKIQGEVQEAANAAEAIPVPLF